MPAACAYRPHSGHSEWLLRVPSRSMEHFGPATFPLTILPVIQPSFSHQNPGSESFPKCIFPVCEIMKLIHFILKK